MTDRVLALAYEHALSPALISGGDVILTGSWYALAWFQAAILDQFKIETPIVYTRRSGVIVDGPRIVIPAKGLA
jgi:hypothetical protein